MKKPLIILALTAMLALALWMSGFRIHDKNDIGELHLPPPSDAMNRADLIATLKGITVSPADSPRIATKDRLPYLGYVVQVCALAEIPSTGPIYIPANADVWRIMKANFKESVPWFDDPAIVKNNMVDVKAIAPKVFKLAP